ncbi:unnamed protein product [Danaus chrysippus]|uniref:(African queen) hypothetical protein n=1 Tax=Danaus chrysippus TaxID=151541 RepID=A0A8J2VR85_9NEOP|nr:unnamed protein product [Danaus chrysippus]
MPVLVEGGAGGRGRPGETGALGRDALTSGQRVQEVLRNDRNGETSGRGAASSLITRRERDERRAESSGERGAGGGGVCV